MLGVAKTVFTARVRTLARELADVPVYGTGTGLFSHRKLLVDAAQRLGAIHVGRETGERHRLVSPDAHKDEDEDSDREEDEEERGSSWRSPTAGIQGGRGKGSDLGVSPNHLSGWAEEAVASGAQATRLLQPSRNT